MTEYGGYLFFIDEQERALLMNEYIERYGTFTDTISAPDWRTKTAEIFLLSLGWGEIHYAALVRRGARVATQKRGIRFTNLVEFDPPILLDEIQKRLDPRIEHHFIRASSGLGSRVPPKTWQGLWEAIKEIRPSSARDLDRLERLRQPQRVLTGMGTEIVAQERDATNLALRIAGFDHSEILEWQLPEQELAPFLQGLPGVNLREDPMIAHDAQVFGDWSLLKKHQVGSAVFHKDGERLTIMNVNRTNVETTLGVDLLYFHHRYQSYVMVQYKRMRREDHNLGYRPIDEAYKYELQAMQEFERSFSKGIGHQELTLDGYRLCPGFFYFKLCPADILDPTSPEMIKGMYIPLDYWEVLIESPDITGRSGGKRITYDNVGRYFNNTLFILLVQSGWIGSRSHDTAIISEVIRAAIAGDRSLILAAQRPVIPEQAVPQRKLS